MRIALCATVMVIGAIVAFGARPKIAGLDTQLVGGLFILVGAAGLAYSLVMLNRRRTARAVVVAERRADSNTIEPPL